MNRHFPLEIEFNSFVFEYCPLCTLLPIGYGYDIAERLHCFTLDFSTHVYYVFTKRLFHSEFETFSERLTRLLRRALRHRVLITNRRTDRKPVFRR